MTTLMRIDSTGLGPEFSAELGPWQEKAAAALQRLKDKNCRGSESTGWYHWPRSGGFALATKIHSLIDSFPLAYDAVVVVGIGGSYAGCKAIDDALRHSYQGFLTSASLLPQGSRPIFYAGHNLAEKQLIELLDILPQRRILLTVISKSGTTTETSVAYRVMRQFMEQTYGKEEARQRTLVVTDAEQGSLRQLARQEGIATFPLPADIGGRFSVLTAVGLLPLSLAGHEVESLLQGADELFASLDENSGETHPVVQLAAIRRCAWERGSRVDMLSYSTPKLQSFVEWWKQLMAESEGKDAKGLFPVGMAYSTDLHSLGQYVQEGFMSMLETFIFFRQESTEAGTPVERRLRVPKLSLVNDGINYLAGRYLEEINDGAMLAAFQAHTARGVPCVKIELPQLDAYTLGYMLAAFEVVAGLSGDLFEVNPYDQPGVEAYKQRMAVLFGKPGYF